MVTLIQLWNRLLSFLRRDRMDRELEEEMKFHLDMRAAENVAAGMSPHEAGYAAQRQFGNPTLLREVSREMWGFRWLETLSQDLRYAIRTLFKSPLFTTVVVLTLALGIGVNTAMFTLFDVFFRPLRISDPHTVVHLEYRSAPGSMTHASFPDYTYFRDHAQVFSGLIANAGVEPILLGSRTSSEAPQKVYAEFVSDNFFSVLGAGTTLGRTFSPQGKGAEVGEPTVVLSHRFWQARLGGDPDIVGKALWLNGKAFNVIGVTVRDFIGLHRVSAPPDLWLPLAVKSELPSQEVLPQNRDWFGSRDLRWLAVSGRLKSGRSAQEAGAELGVLLGQLARAYPEIDAKATVVVTPASGLGRRNNHGFWAIWALVMAATTIVLLIACSNLANLLLARAAARQKEIGVRLCLGASRGRLIRQLLTESFLLAGLGGSAGVLLSWWSLKAFLATGLLSLAGARDREIYAVTLHLDPDVRILTYAFLLSLLTGIAFGLAPALRATRADLATTLKDEGSSFSQRMTRSGLRNGLVVAQVSLCLVLLIAAGVLLRAVIRSAATDPGFEMRRVLVVEPRLDLSAYDPIRARQFRHELRTRLEALPGVQSVCEVSNIPLQQSERVTMTLSATGHSLQGFYNSVTPNFFETFGIPIVHGRGFGLDERHGDAATVVVTESTARRLWPNQEPLGQLLQVEPTRRGRETAQGSAPFFRVIGVARDAQNVRLGETDPLFVYVPLAPGHGNMLVRTSADAKALRPLVQDACRALDPALLLEMYSLSDAVDSRHVGGARAASALATGLGLLALGLAAVGLYGVMAYAVGHRTREIGIRMALGASRRDVLLLVIGQGMRLVGVGVAVGIGGGAAVSRALSSLTILLSPFDPIAYVAVSAFLMMVATLAMYLPARRAATVDPMVALRYE